MHKEGVVTIGFPYPKAGGSQCGYRVFDGNRWYDCDKNGKIKR